MKKSTKLGVTFETKVRSTVVGPAKIYFVLIIKYTFFLVLFTFASFYTNEVVKKKFSYVF
jgi:hypothetical protein